MSADGHSYDVAVVGASVAGCTAARLFALRGARVALVEARPAMDAAVVLMSSSMSLKAFSSVTVSR